MIQCRVIWEGDADSFASQKYSRAHRWQFDGGEIVRASSSPDVVPVPLSDASAVDPEEAFVASLSSCHMLWFLAIAARRGYELQSYDDEATGVMTREEGGKMVISEVVLRPKLQWVGQRIPDANEIDSMHHEAHEECFTANSVKTHIRVESS